MNYTSKPFLALCDQVELMKSRGLIIPDENFAKDFLRTENYYRLSGYWLTFYDRSTDTFSPGSCFSTIVDLYQFDQNLRSIIMRYCSIIEINLRSFLAHYHAEHYGPLGYYDYRNFDNAYHHAEFINRISIESKKRNDYPFVSHYQDSLDGVYPIWVAIELLNFNYLSKLFKNLLPSDRCSISRQYYGIPSREYIESWIQTAVIFRNKSAHGARLYNTTFNAPVKLPSSLTATSRTVFGAVYALSYLLSADNHASFVTEIDSCLSNHPSVRLSFLGFPANWKDILS